MVSKKHGQKRGESFIVESYYPKSLIEGAVKGDKEDFAKLLEYCMKDILYLATARTNKQDAEDIAQEVAIILQRKIHTLSNPNHFSKWLLVVVRNASISYMRKHFQSKDDIGLEEYIEQYKELDKLRVEEAEFLPEQYVEDKELCGIVVEEIRKLPKNQRICLSYHYLQEFKRADIVEVTEFTPAQVTSALYSGKKTLKQKLEKRLGEALPYSVAPIGAVPAMARAFEAMQEEMVPAKWCEQMVQKSLEGLPAVGELPTGEVSAGGMSTGTKCLLGAVVCTAAVGVVSVVSFLNQETPAPEEISPPVVEVQQEQVEYLDEPDQPDQDEPLPDNWEIRTVEDMIGGEEADVLRGFVGYVDARQEWQEFIERIGAEEYERASEYRDTYITYTLEKQNKRLILAEHDPGDGEIRVFYLFGDRDEPVEAMTRIILGFRIERGTSPN